MFLLPFLPLAMRGMQQLMLWMPRVQEWGQKTANWIETMIQDMQTQGFWKGLWMSIGPPLMTGLSRVLGVIPGVDATIYKKDASSESGVVVDEEATAKYREAKELEHERKKESYSTFQDLTLQGERTGAGTGRFFVNQGVDILNKATSILGVLTTGSRSGLVENIPQLERAEPMGQQYSPVIKRGDQVSGLGAIEGGIGSIMNSMEVSLARQSEKVQNYATQFQQKEMGAGGVLARWDDEVLRGSIPDTWDSIDDMYRKMNDELADEARNAEMLDAGLVLPAINPGESIGVIQSEIEQALAALASAGLDGFVLPANLAEEIDQCFTIANQCLNTKFTSLAELVEGGVRNVQMGVGGSIFNLESVNDLVTQAQGMGGAVASQAAGIAADVALMVQQLADKDMPLTVDVDLLATRIIDLNSKVDAKVLGTASEINNATKEVNDIVTQWTRWESPDHDTSLEGWQFGGLGAAFGEATGRAQQVYNRIKGRKPPRVKRMGQITGTGSQPVDEPDPDPEPVISEPEPMPPIFEPDEFEEEWGAPEEQIISIPDEPLVSEENMDIFNDYVDSRAEAITEAAMSTDIDVSRSMDWLDPGMGWGEQFGGAGGYGGRRGVHNVSHSVMNININTKSSVQDILSDLKRVQYMDDASFFNSVS